MLSEMSFFFRRVPGHKSLKEVLERIIRANKREIIGIKFFSFLKFFFFWFLFFRPEQSKSYSSCSGKRRNDCKLRFHALFCQSHQFRIFIVVVIAKNYTIKTENCLSCELSSVCVRFNRINERVSIEIVIISERRESSTCRRRQRAQMGVVE